MTHISQQQLESYLWGAATLLRGTIDAGDYKQFIFPLLFYKRLCDAFDEETQAALKESGGDASFRHRRDYSANRFGQSDQLSAIWRNGWRKPNRRSANFRNCGLDITSNS